MSIFFIIIGKISIKLFIKLSKYYISHNTFSIFSDVVLSHTLPIFTGLGRCPIVNWDFVGAVSIFGPDAPPVIHQ